MRKKSSRRRIDVNVDELDRIIDAAMQAPLNEADGRTLKTAVHAMAERLIRRRNTEKTSAVLEPQSIRSNRRNRRRRDTGATGHLHLREQTESPWRMPRFTPATFARNAAKEKCTARRNRRR